MGQSHGSEWKISGENGRVLDDLLQKITKAAVKGGRLPANSIIVATSATIGEHALITVLLLGQSKVYIPRAEARLCPAPRYEVYFLLLLYLG